jgi:hypothetical protein
MQFVRNRFMPKKSYTPPVVTEVVPEKNSDSRMVPLRSDDLWAGTFDNESKLIAPWYTRNFLEVLVTWDISKWKVFEYGGGNSTLWWRHHVRQVHTIDTHEEWSQKIGIQCATSEEEFLNYPLEFINTEKFDCIIIDGDKYSRDKCTEIAIKCLKPAGILIIDNYEQPSVPADWTLTNELLKNITKHVYLQPGHPDWKTAYWVMDDSTPKRKMISDRTIGNGAYGTHIAPLMTAVMNTSGPVFEMGCGDFSTPFLHELCKKQGKYLLSTDTSNDWISLFLDMQSDNHEFKYVPVYEDDWEKNPKPELWDTIGNQSWGVVFVDHRPGERRRVDIERFADNAEIIVAHDTEYDGYEYEKVFCKFKYRFDYKRYSVYTTLVSNTVDVSALFT